MINSVVSTKKRVKLVLGLSFCMLGLAFNCYAKEIAIFYTGSTHAMLYQCSCPVEPDGGLARRATLIKELRKKYPDSLLLDSGAYFAGGQLDEYTLNTELDMRRTEVNLKAMELMKYDALGISPDEFNFGAQFFKDSSAKLKLNFVSSNINAPSASPYIIKDLSGAKVGIVGVSPEVIKRKAADINVSDPKEAVASAVGALKAKGVNIIVLLSSLSEQEDAALIESVPGIDVLIEGRGRSKEEPFVKKGNTIILRPSWQARKLGKAVLTLKDNKITGQKVEQLRLSSKVQDDRAILSTIPRCFSGGDCKKEGVNGECLNPGELGARCEFAKTGKVQLFVITEKDCITCSPQIVADSLKKQFPGIEAVYLDRRDKKAENMLKNFGITGLPAYLLGKEIEKEKNFDLLKSGVDLRGDYYLIKPQASGVAFFTDRERIKGRLDLFISLYDKDSAGVLQAVREFNPQVHFLATYEEGNFDAKNDNIEVEEYRRGVCVQRYYPQEYWNYIACRAKNIGSSWWEDCLSNLDSSRIKSCARSGESEELLRKNIGLNKELGIMFGPTYLLDNQEVFSSKGAPSREELKKIIKR